MEDKTADGAMGQEEIEAMGPGDDMPEEVAS
jgi:hypothetical protein